MAAPSALRQVGPAAYELSERFRKGMRVPVRVFASDKLVQEMSQLSGPDFDRRYAKNEHGYHIAINGLVEKTFIPNIENAEVKALFKQALAIFRAHEHHAHMMVKSLED